MHLDILTQSLPKELAAHLRQGDRDFLLRSLDEPQVSRIIRRLLARQHTKIVAIGRDLHVVERLEQLLYIIPVVPIHEGHAEALKEHGAEASRARTAVAEGFVDAAL